ncbi:MAG: hypothetical protein DSM106950_25375 [Stigonema ocellatum SAG 48.90 = DSM 106950]|nr:hypothetical protein [Stigonema ocellatum SAG 48.90 = DSM 106950]
MSYLRLLGNPLTLLVITLSLCVAVRNRFDPRHSFQVQAQAPTTTTPTPSSTATPTPSSTATPTPSSTPSPSPLPSYPLPGYVNKDNNPLIVLKGQWWKTTNTSEQVYALSFDKLNDLTRGKLTIWYKDPSGIFSQDAEYELVPIDNKNSNVKAIDIFLRKNKVIRTIFKIEIDKVKGRILQIQLKGLNPGEGRPDAITPEGVESFSTEYYSP